jgi:hypothetical protein
LSNTGLSLTEPGYEATNDETISSYDEWFNAKYGNWFDDKKYGEQHQKWRGKLKPLEVIMNPECNSQAL